MLCALANALAARGMEVYVLTWDVPGAKSFYPLAPRVTWHRLGFAPGWPDKLRRMFALRRVLRHNRIGTLIGFVMSGDLTVYTAALTSGTRILAAERNAPAMYSILYTPLRRWLNFNLLRLADRVMLQSPDFRTGYPKAVARKTVVIPNPVARPDAVADPVGAKGARKILLCVGRLEPVQKRPGLLLQAFARVAPAAPEWDLHFVGDGPAQADLKAQIADLDLAGRVQLCPSTPDIGASYVAAQLYATPSAWEGFPNALAEAMAYGLPAVGFASSEGVGAMLRHAGAWCVYGQGQETDQAQALSVVLAEAMADPQARQARGAAARHSMQIFAPDQIFDAWSQVIAGQDPSLDLGAAAAPPLQSVSKEDPLVTIGITTYNAVDTLPQALASALAQTWPRTEIVVVDDCSSDGSWALLQGWAAEDSKIRRIFRQNINGGVAKARNRILAEARGAFIAFFDDDDVSASDRVTLQLDRIRRYEADFAQGAPVICHTACQRHFPDGTTIEVATMGLRPGEVAPHGAAVARRVLLGARLEDAYGSLPTCSQMARREVYALVGGFDDALRRIEDTDLVIRLALAGAHFVGLEQPLVLQTMTPTSEKTLATEQVYMLQVLGKHAGFIEAHGSYAFVCRWIEVKHLWYQERRLRVIGLVLGLLVRFPRSTLFRLGMAMPRLRINLATRAFRKAVQSADSPGGEAMYEGLKEGAERASVAYVETVAEPKTPMAWSPGTLPDLICPGSCHAPLVEQDGQMLCSRAGCIHADPDKGFRIIEGTPVVISTQNCDTVCDPDRVVSYVPRAPGFLTQARAALIGESPVTRRNCARFVANLKASVPTAGRPRVLIIGAGEKGQGTANLWDDPQLDRIGVDIYKSENVDLVCDAHYLPLPSESFDGVWIQTVLEHVVGPAVVVAEIHRVLRPKGLVYAETPFMQQVHEGAYDFTRFTVTGHRYLFRDFEMIEIGGNGGAEVSLAWSIRYFVWALARSARLARLVGNGVQIVLRPFGYLTSRASLHDAASGTFFLGRKSSRRIRHRDLITLYRGQG